MALGSRLLFLRAGGLQIGAQVPRALDDAAPDRHALGLELLERRFDLSTGERLRQRGSVVHRLGNARRDMRARHEGRIAELEDKLSRAEVIDVSKLSGDTVKFGAKVKLVDEHVDHPDRVLLRDIVIQIFWKQDGLTVVLTLDEALHLRLRSSVVEILTQPAFSHSLGQKRKSRPCGGMPGERTSSDRLGMSEKCSH